jgi:hypothetical protein
MIMNENNLKVYVDEVVISHKHNYNIIAKLVYFFFGPYLKVSIQTIWIERNDLIFNYNKWHEVKFRKVIWVGWS